MYDGVHYLILSIIMAPLLSGNIAFPQTFLVDKLYLEVVAVNGSMYYIDFARHYIACWHGSLSLALNHLAVNEWL